MSHPESVGMTVDDVYKLAHDIAAECEKIVQLHDMDTVKPLIEKVIKSLELLESSVKKIMQLELELGELTTSNLHLSSLKIMSQQNNAKLKQTYEEAEESWLQEVIALKTRISTLEKENKSLRSFLLLREEEASSEADKNVIEDQENAIHRLRHSLRQKDRQLQESASNISVLNSKIEELLRFNKILHIQNQKVKRDINQLIVENNKFESEWILLKGENQLLIENIRDCNPLKQKDCRGQLELPKKMQIDLQLEKHSLFLYSCYFKETVHSNRKSRSSPHAL